MIVFPLSRLSLYLQIPPHRLPDGQKRQKPAIHKLFDLFFSVFFLLAVLLPSLEQVEYIHGKIMKHFAACKNRDIDTVFS